MKASSFAGVSLAVAVALFAVTAVFGSPPEVRPVAAPEGTALLALTIVIGAVAGFRWSQTGTLVPRSVNESDKMTP